MQATQYLVVVLSTFTPLAIGAGFINPSKETILEDRSVTMFSKRGFGNLRHRHGFKSGEPAYQRLTETSPSRPQRAPSPPAKAPSSPPPKVPPLGNKSTPGASSSRPKVPNRGPQGQGRASRSPSPGPSPPGSPRPGRPLRSKSSSSLHSQFLSSSSSLSSIASTQGSRPGSPALSRASSTSSDKGRSLRRSKTLGSRRGSQGKPEANEVASATVKAQGSPDRPYKAFTKLPQNEKNYHIGTHFGDSSFTVKHKAAAAAGGSSPANGHLIVSAQGTRAKVKFRVKEGGSGYVQSVYGGNVQETRHYTHADGKQQLEFHPDGSGQNMGVIAGIHGEGHVAVKAKMGKKG